MTGTRSGMTPEQAHTFYNLLEKYKGEWFHHGDCQGADAEGHDFATELGYKTHVHPPIKDEVRAFKQGTTQSENKGYFARNRDIVDESEILFGTPVTMFETQGGTWYTINYAKKKNKPIIIVFPDGTTEEFNLPK